MKRNTIKWRIFKYNILVIVVLILLTTFVFNIAIRLYIENDVVTQLKNISMRAEETALHKGPDFFNPPENGNPPIPKDSPNNPYFNSNRQNLDIFSGKANDNQNNKSTSKTNRFAKSIDPIRFYYMLDRSLREPLSVLNADYVLYDSKKAVINAPDIDYFKPSDTVVSNISQQLKSIKNSEKQQYLKFNISGIDYIAITTPVSSKNSFGLGWIIIYSSLEKVNQLQLGINAILFIILLISSLIIAIFSSIAAKKISEPFSSLNHYIREIAERKFGTKVETDVYDELQEVVNNINIMSEKLEVYDKAQKTFLQNASHEFRTPLMSIQSYAEGIKYEVVDHNSASNIIIDETKRMTSLVENVLYLSRLDAIEENYHFSSLEITDFVKSCVERMNGIALKSNIELKIAQLPKKKYFIADEEKFSRAIANIISNCIRYAKTTVFIRLTMVDETKIQLFIQDDGPGIAPEELPNIFERFYKGKKGNFGLGLAITKNILEKHNGQISAENTDTGALFKIEIPIEKLAN